MSIENGIESLSALMEQIQDGTEAEGLMKALERVMDKYRDAVFSALLKKQTTDNLHNLNSVCVALGMLHTTLQNKITNKQIAEKDLKEKRKEEE